MSTSSEATQRMEDLGLQPDRTTALLERARREVEDGLLPSCQLAVARKGRLALFEAFGAAGTDTRYVIFSCTKPILASAVWLLIGEGRLDVGQKVAELVPEFGTNGKEAVTVEQVMLHTSGFPRAPMGPDVWSDRACRLQRFGEWWLSWRPGTASEYHPTSAHWVLAEVIERVSGVDYREFVRDRVAVPLGLPRLQLGVPRSEQDDIAELTVTGEPPSPDELEATLGVRELPVGEVTNQNLLLFNDPAVRAVGVPGAGAVATAAEVALFYQALLHNPGPLWDPDVLADATARVRNRMPDRLLRVPANRSIGLVVAGDDGLAPWRGLPRTGSPRAFGHNGAGGEVAWADPDSGLSFCYLTNGIDANLLRQYRRGISLSNRAALLSTGSQA